MTTNQIFVPTRGIASWRGLLAQPTKHWKDGRSAKTLAQAWETARGVPREIHSLLKPLGDVELLFAIPEYKVELPGGRRASQNDVFALFRTDTGLLVTMVEGKVDEPFGPTLAEWRRRMSTGKRSRLDYLCGKIGLPTALDDTIRYQLLHRATSAVVVAERFHADDAAIVIHSFHSGDESFSDYRSFVALYDKTAKPGELIQLGTTCGIRLWSGWANGVRKS